MSLGQHGQLEDGGGKIDMEAGTNSMTNENTCELKCFPFLRDMNVSSLFKFSQFPEFHGTRILLLLTLIGCVLSNWEWAMTALCSNVASVLIEAKILKIISSIFLSANIFWSMIDVLIIVAIGLITERIKGTYSFVIFIITVAFTSQLMTLLIYLSMYYLTWNTFYLESRICGLSSLIGTFAVVLAEISPNSVLIRNRQSIIVRCKYSPFLMFLTTLFMSMMGISVTEMCLIECGLYCSWLFLRYFQFNAETGMKGNLNDEFALGMLFPPILRIPIVLLANCFYAVCDSVGFCHSSNGTDGGTSTSGGIGSNNQMNNYQSHSQQSHTSMDALIDQSGGNDIDASPLDPEQQKKRDEAKKQIEQRLAELRKDMSDRAKNRQIGNGTNGSNVIVRDSKLQTKI